MNTEFKDDRELIRAMLAGNEGAFRSFFDIYFPRLYRFAMPRLGKDEQAVKDVVQSTLVRAVRSLASFRGEAALFTWLCQIFRRQVVDYLRANNRHADNVVLIEDNPELRSAMEFIEAGDESRPEHAYESQAARRIVQSVLDRLPNRYGDVLEWKYIEGCSVQEIGERLGVGHTAAQSLLARARVAFREAVESVFGRTTSEVLADLRGT